MLLAFWKQWKWDVSNDDCTVWEIPWHECATAIQTDDINRRCFYFIFICFFISNILISNQNNTYPIS